MKKLIVLAAMMIAGIQAFAQTTTEKDTKKHEWRVRLRGLAVIPQEKADIGVIGGDAEISTSIIPELDFTYFFNRHFAAELILGTTRHKVNTAGSDLSAIGLSSSAEVNLGKVWLLPPTLTFQYHYPVGKINPYVGAGVNYTIFYGVDEGPVVADIEYKNKFAFAAQAGIDIDITNKFFLNIDVKKIFLNTEATVDAGNLTPSDSPSLKPVLSDIKADVKIRPWLVGFGVGCRF